MVSQKMSYIKWRLLKITLQAPFLNVVMTSVHISSVLVLHGNDVGKAPGLGDPTDDLYNNLKVYEPEFKGTSSSNTSIQNMVFVSSNNSGSTNEAVNTAHGVCAASTQVSAANSTTINNLSDVVICALFASQPNSPQLDNKDLQQINPDDLEDVFLGILLGSRLSLPLHITQHESKKKREEEMKVLERETRERVECQAIDVLFFPSPRFFPLGFSWEGFLRRQTQMTSYSPSLQIWDTCGDSCALKWFFPTGVIVSVFEVKLVDVTEMNYTSDDQPYPRGEICLLRVRGPIVFQGYYKDEVHTREVIDGEGWLHTGDIRMWIPGGRLKIIDSSLDVNQASVSVSADPDTEKATDEQQQVVKQARAAEERERAAKERQQATEDRQHALLKRVKELEEQVKESANMCNPMDMATTSGQYRLMNPQRFAADYNHNDTYTSADCVHALAHMTDMCANHTAFMGTMNTHRASFEYTFGLDSSTGFQELTYPHATTNAWPGSTNFKLEIKEQIELKTNKKPQPKKITGFQFSSSNPSEVLVTSVDSLVRILDGAKLVKKYKGMDKSIITRKQSKASKHGHENQKSTKPKPNP
ncbi:ribonuclease H-like domain-containing protein [Tanacetum coccineum]|uniref:Ribonuclease H-like domain-containing protein n=1 Tax=Tanacetum coccineum TaxID=301880 RepID=A0ABQ4WP22_9ASTR